MVLKENRYKVGVGYPVYIIAEISANHCQRFDDAVKLVKVAKEVGADAVKLQTYTPDTLTIKCDRPEFLIKGGSPWDGRNLYELYSKAYMPWEWHPELKKIADKIGIELFSTAYDKTAVDFLEELQVPIYKIASMELVDTQLIEYVARKKKPIIMSTGMANLNEISEAVETAKKAGNTQIILLKCTSAYPSLPEEMNLLAIPYLFEVFGLPVGISDHTLEIVVPVAAVALGACVVEKHITISRNVPTPDREFSLEPSEFKAMVDGIRTVGKALGKRKIGMTKMESRCQAQRRSLFVVEDMKIGDVFTEQNVRSIRPGYGLLPKYLMEILGKKASRDIQRGTPLQWELVI